MKILIPGDKKASLQIKRFQCSYCGCVFEADKTEYKSNISTGSFYATPFYECECPCCGEDTKFMVYEGMVNDNT